MNAAGVVASRVDRSTTTAVLAVGDLALILLFFVLGELRHGGVAALPSLPSSAAPFLFGWVVASLVVGVYGAPWRDSAFNAAVRTAGAWTGAVAIGQLLRDSPLLPGSADPAFVLVSLVVGAVLLVPWRLAAFRYGLV
jgi:hypothetical protein